MKLTERQLERILNDKNYWATIAAEIIASAAQNVPPGTSDSGIAEVGSMPQSLGRIHESYSPQRTRVRFPLPGPGPRGIPMIAEVKTISPEGSVLLSQSQARRRLRQWDRGRLRAQEQAQKQGEGGSVGMDHPSESCRQAHPDETHDEFLIRTHGEEEEASQNPQDEEEENVNPMFRDRRTSYATGRRYQR